MAGLGWISAMGPVQGPGAGRLPMDPLGGGAAGPSGQAGAVHDAARTFGKALREALEGVNSLQHDADRLTQDFVTGATDDIAGVMMAGTKANLALQYTLELRNKMLEAYQEIIRMQI